ncbi:MAG: DUF2779 domain-containing protein [Bacilli bacterium]|nr:DUF2779 domain-containing protein [Bacilli bacterium]
MAITKTKFINYIRCPRYAALDNIKKDKLDSIVTFEEYKKEEEETKLLELLDKMYDETGEDIIDITSSHMETMMPYYNEVEILAGHLAPKYFNGKFRFARDTQNQESFDALIGNIRYICYADIYNEDNNEFRIIECKATTTKKYLKLGFKDNSIFQKDKDGIYKLLEELDVKIEDYMPIEKYKEAKSKLIDKYSGPGHYVYDLAVQRFMIENDLKQNNDKRTGKYYLAVLNSKYVFDGKYENGKPKYDEINGEDIISFIDLTSITESMMDNIQKESKLVEGYINDLHAEKYPLGTYCEKKKTVKCKYCDICWSIIPEKHSIFTYLFNHKGFKKDGINYSVFDLVNSGKVNMLDIDESYLTRDINIIQRRALENNDPYVDKKKIIDGLKQIKYPIYHLDFETFNCPLPRFKGEVPYSQSVFQFSLHIEKEPGKCDNEKDHYGFLAKDHEDHREELIKYMCDLIGEGTVLVYNESFEKTRIKELAEIFPEYRERLLKINSQIFDLMNIVKNKTSLYKELGYNKEEAKKINYYNPDMDGSYSIKKVLPIFSNITYQGMEVANGVEAMVTYAKFPKLNKKDFEHKYQKLVEYCQQDTYAMFKVLEGLKKEVDYKV